MKGMMIMIFEFLGGEEGSHHGGEDGDLLFGGSEGDD